MASSCSEAVSLKTKVQPVLAALLVGVLLSLGAFAPVAAASRVPKVAIVVGPVGDITPRYRSLANEAAAVARDAGAQVVKVYSPNATWPAVKQALKGASIVIYLGHGNGWPSRYRDALYPPSQNGFGLNPVAGVDDQAHQYFGEASVDDVRLARNAVVLLHHLCYASGNTEPGLPEGTVDMAIQRVDNYAAGFIRAGAAAVVAEAHMGPAWYVRQLLTTKASIESIWNRSPQANGNTMRIRSERSRGFTARLDPDNASSGFYRSLVSRGVTAGQLRNGASGSVTRGSGSVSGAVVGPPPVPTLAQGALKFGTLALGALPIASTQTKVTIPVSGNAAGVPKGAQIGLRWDPILLDAPDTPAAPPATPTPSPSPSPVAPGASQAVPDPGASTSPSPSGSASPSPDASPAASASPSPTALPSPATSPGTAAAPGPSASPAAPATPAAPPAASPQATTAAPEAPAAPSATPTVNRGLFTLPEKETAPEPVAPEPEPGTVAIPTEAPAVDLVVAERQGSVVEPVAAKSTADGLAVDVTFPTAPGLYRLVPTLHTPTGEAYDAATQAMLTPVLVRIGGKIAVAYGAPATLTLPAGMEAAIPVRVLNSGSERWDLSVTLQPGEAGDEAYHTSEFPAVLTGTWVSTTAAPVPAASSAELDTTIAGPGGDVSVTLDITAPASPGEYLLLLDTISPTRGALSALGSTPALVRVTVTESIPSPSPVPPQRKG
ncbi:MAG TPA: hypothetical protein VFY23_07455 [Candidatus Limnocylindrales bacterium]|nr:hypothetical protein [Candidatus Limnocylindrales bacterium]